MPLTGLSGLTGFSDPTPQATPEERLGGTADPRHGQIGEVATPYPWEAFPGESHGPYGLENALIGMPIVSTGAGYLGEDPTADLTPITHAAPWPKGVPNTTDPDQMAERLDESASIHASNMGGSREALYIPTQEAVQDNWQEATNYSEGTSLQVPIPDQIKTGGSAGWGSRDRTQSNAPQNQYGYGAKHWHRRYADGNIPGNFLWMEGGSRPMQKTIPGTAKIPVGNDSPFAGQDPTVSYDPQGAALENLPVVYEASPEPATIASFPEQSVPSIPWF